MLPEPGAEPAGPADVLVELVNGVGALPVGLERELVDDQAGVAEHELGGRRVGAWLWEHYQTPPDWVQLGGVWPLGDSPPVLVTALSTESSRWTTVPPSAGATAHVCTDVDFRLVVGDMLAKLRGHERLRTT